MPGLEGSLERQAGILFEVLRITIGRSGQRSNSANRSRSSNTIWRWVGPMVRAHKGRIWAENVAGGGAVFRLSLPLCLT